uniref:Uncharacterized protein n=1 Tax=Panagrolaimus sp. JU765 TaxID=591449 RepID=A0AC34Q364_9BILA
MMEQIVSGRFRQETDENENDDDGSGLIKIAYKFGVEKHRRYTEVYFCEETIEFVFLNGESVITENDEDLRETLNVYYAGTQLKVHAIGDSLRHGRYEENFLGDYYFLWRESLATAEELVFTGEWPASTISFFGETVPNCNEVSLLDCNVTGFRARLKTVLRAIKNNGIAPTAVTADTCNFPTHDFATNLQSALEVCDGALSRLRLLMPRMPTEEIYESFEPAIDQHTSPDAMLEFLIMTPLTGSSNFLLRQGFHRLPVPRFYNVVRDNSRLQFTLYQKHLVNALVCFWIME